MNVLIHIYQINSVVELDRLAYFFAGSSSAPYTTSKQRRAASRYYFHEVLIGAVVDAITGKKSFW